MRYLRFFIDKPLLILLAALPLALLAEFLHWGAGWIFVFSAIGVIPMAELIGEATEALTSHTSPRIGGLLNATLGNAAELIITIVAIREGLLELVKASITGSILGNLLLVIGVSFLAGGLKNGVQTFDSKNASRYAILMILSVIALVIPSIFSAYIGESTDIEVEALSLGVAGVMIVIYALSLVFSFRGDGIRTVHKPVESVQHDGWPLRTAFIVLGLATLGVVVLSELLVGAVEPVVESLGISEFFIGIILVPLIGNVAEHFVAVEVALRNKMDLSVEIAVASSSQIALFVAPVLVFISLLFGNPLQLIFNEFELLALIAGVIIAGLVTFDGESNWLEGAQLLAIYIILALAFFLLPTVV
jgi:Ca2+:H+ antiporter